MTTPPPTSAVAAQRKQILKYIAMAVSALSVLAVLTVFALIVRSESAHDEKTCPFAPVSEQTFEGGKVVEQGRTCVNGISEHRFLVERPGHQSFELARKRLATDHFEPGRFHWGVTLDAQQRVQINMRVDGKPSSEFREEDAVAH